MKTITIRVSDSEYKELINKADGRPLGKFLLKCTLSNDKQGVIKPLMSSNDKELVAKTLNPFVGWWVEPAPDGSVKGFYSDEHGSSIKVITNGKKFQTLRSDNPFYNQF